MELGELAYVFDRVLLGVDTLALPLQVIKSHNFA